MIFDHQKDVFFPFLLAPFSFWNFKGFRVSNFGLPRLEPRQHGQTLGLGASRMDEIYAKSHFEGPLSKK